MVSKATEREYATQILATLPHAATVIELGAHHGNDTVALFDACINYDYAHPGAHGVKYIAVEADPRNVPVLTRRLFGMQMTGVLHAAIWNYCGEIPFYLCEGNAHGSSSAREPLEHLNHFPGIPFRGEVLVPALTLDAIAAAYEIDHVDLIWCDIQGAERNMIAGGRHTLARTSWLLTECDRIEMYRGQATRDELLEILGADWELVAEWPENANLLLRNRRV